MPANPNLPKVAETAAVVMFGYGERTIPTKEKYDALVGFAQSQYDYYRDTLKVADPVLGPYEALGAALALENWDFNARQASIIPWKLNRIEAFAMDNHLPSGLSLSIKHTFFAPEVVVNNAYQDIFGRAPTTDQVAFFKNQINYYQGLYAATGMDNTMAQVKAEGAAIGVMVGYAVNDASEYLRPSQILDNITQTVLVGLASGNGFGTVWPG